MSELIRLCQASGNPSPFRSSPSVRFSRVVIPGSPKDLEPMDISIGRKLRPPSLTRILKGAAGFNAVGRYASLVSPASKGLVMR